MGKNDWLKEKISKLEPEERSEIDDFLINGIAEDALTKAEKFKMVLASSYIDEARALRESWGKMQGLSSGYLSIDKLTKGFVPGELVIVGGATSNGKTTLAVNIAAKVLRKGHRVLFVTMEMTRAQLTSRLMFVDEDFENNASLLAYQQSDEFDWKSVDGLIATAKKELEVDLVIIDHLHHFTRELKNVSEDLGRITKEFQKNAHRHNIPIIVISHTRKGEGNKIDDLRGSSYIAQDADVVLMVNRDEQLPDIITVAIVKNRNRGFELNDNEIHLDFDRTKLSEPSEYEIPFK